MRNQVDWPLPAGVKPYVRFSCSHPKASSTLLPVLVVPHTPWHMTSGSTLRDDSTVAYVMEESGTSGYRAAQQKNKRLQDPSVQRDPSRNMFSSRLTGW